jgi:glycosyltransferase involved in cell wall biosynthesis
MVRVAHGRIMAAWPLRGPRAGGGRPTAASIAGPVAGMTSVSVVVPVYDERDSLRPLADELLPVVRGLGIPVEVIFVDDGSRDGSAEVLADLAASEPEVCVVRLRRNFGKAAALMAGFRQASGDAVVTLDADLQDDPAEIPRLLAALEDGADLVSGWKQRRMDPWTKRAASRVFNGVTARMSGLRLHDLNCGFKAYRAEVVRSLALTGDLYRYIPVLAANEGFRVRELAVNHRPRRYGRSKYGLERYVRGFLDLLTILFIGRFRHRPMHLFGGLGLVTTLGGLGISAYMAALRLTGHGIGGRPLLLLGVLMIVVGIQLFTIGLVSEMIQRNRQLSEADEARARVERVIR